jgi:hypothetical protein
MSPQQPRSWSAVSTGTGEAAQAADRILHRQASVHRLVSHGEIREHHTRQRWWLRRVALVLILLMIAGPINHGFYHALVRHQVLAARPAMAETVAWGMLPLQTLCAVAASTDFPPAIAAAQTVEAASSLVEGICDGFVQLALGKQALSFWALLALPLLIVAGYSLSPGPVWWGFRLCAVEFMAYTYRFMEFLYAPLAWLVDRSHTVRGFYEAYYDGMEWID